MSEYELKNDDNTTNQLQKSYYIKPKFDSIPELLKKIRTKKNELAKTMFATPFDDQKYCTVRNEIFNEICDLWAETMITIAHQSQGYIGAKSQQVEAFSLTFTWINQNLKSLKANSKADVFRVLDMLEVFMLELLPNCLDTIVGTRSKRAGKETFTLERVMLQNSWNDNKHWWQKRKRGSWSEQFNLPDREKLR